MITFPEDIHLELVECIDIEKHLYPEHELIPPDTEDAP